MASCVYTYLRPPCLPAPSPSLSLSLCLSCSLSLPFSPPPSRALCAQKSYTLSIRGLSSFAGPEERTADIHHHHVIMPFIPVSSCTASIILDKLNLYPFTVSVWSLSPHYQFQQKNRLIPCKQMNNTNKLVPRQT